MTFLVFTEEEKAELFDDDLVIVYSEDEEEFDTLNSLVEEYTVDEFQVVLESLDDELAELVNEAYTRHVSSTGKVTRRKSRAIRSRRAVQTTGRSKSSLRRSGRKAARTRRRNVSGQRKALRKRRKALRRRKSLNIK